MFPYALIDLHCDTLTDFPQANGSKSNTLDDPERALSLRAIPPRVHWAQFYAVFIPDEKQGQAAEDYFEKNRLNFERQMNLYADRVAPCRGAADMEAAWAAGKTAAFLTVENGTPINGDLSRIKVLADQGVCCMTLVWNGDYEIGSGHTTQKGLTDFGKAVIPELEKNGILIDVSHLNDAGFADLLTVARRPFVATHSNARSVCNHKRNLTDDMIREMARRDCLIGLNYYVNFLSEDGVVNSLAPLHRHIEHFFALGAQKNLALGSDYDGATLPDCLDTPAKAAGIYEYLLSSGMSEELAQGIMYRNAQEFFRRNLP